MQFFSLRQTSVCEVGFCSTRWMREGEEVVGRRRRSSQEIQRLVVEFRTSGLRQSLAPGWSEALSRREHGAGLSPRCNASPNDNYGNSDKKGRSLKE
jgi:hypothetical protein